jgi:hypothetical protein
LEDEHELTSIICSISALLPALRVSYFLGGVFSYSKESSDTPKLSSSLYVKFCMFNPDRAYSFEFW